MIVFDAQTCREFTRKKVQAYCKLADIPYKQVREWATVERCCEVLGMEPKKFLKLVARQNGALAVVFNQETRKPIEKYPVNHINWKDNLACIRVHPMWVDYYKFSREVFKNLQTMTEDSKSLKQLVHTNIWRGLDYHDPSVRGFQGLKHFKYPFPRYK